VRQAGRAHGLAALVAVHPRRVECALAAIGHGADGYLGVGSCFADTGGETPGRFSALMEPLNVSGAMTMRTAFPSRAEFIRIRSRRSDISVIY
jgi:hypothetical protein